METLEEPTAQSADWTHVSPAAYLMMETLAARARLGEGVWTFPKNVSFAARRLEEAGLVGWKSGIVERTIIVWMTDKARELWLAAPYEAPSGTVNISALELTTLRRDLAEAQAALFPAAFDA